MKAEVLPSLVVLYRIADVPAPEVSSVVVICARCRDRCWIAETTVRAVPPEAERLCTVCVARAIASGEIKSPLVMPPSDEERAQLVERYGAERVERLLGPPTRAS